MGAREGGLSDIYWQSVHRRRHDWDPDELMARPAQLAGLAPAQRAPGDTFDPTPSSESVACLREGLRLLVLLLLHLFLLLLLLLRD